MVIMLEGKIKSKLALAIHFRRSERNRTSSTGFGGPWFTINRHSHF